MEKDCFAVRIFRLTMLCWLFFKGLSPKLWFSFGRIFPMVPAIPFFEKVPPGVQDFFSIVSLSGIFFLLVRPNIKWVQTIVILTELFLQACDLMRGQPMFFQFWITLVLFRFGKPYFHYYFTLLLAATYFFSGLHKLNQGFINEVWKNLILTRFLNIGPFPLLVKLGWAIGVVECLFGLGLLTRYYKWALKGLIAMHLFILVFLGPPGLNFNRVVWPWNVLMIAIAILCHREQDWIRIFPVQGRYLLPFAFLFLVLLPVFSFTGNYNPYFSFAMYGGGNSRLYMISDKSGPEKYYWSKGADFLPVPAGASVVSINRWCLNELGVPVPPASFYYFRIKESLRKKEPDSRATWWLMDYPFRKKNIRQLK